MSINSFFSKIVASAKALLKDGETEVVTLFKDVEPALLSFVKQVDHDFVQKWMPQALTLVTNLLASGNALTTATLSQAASELEQTALKTGAQVLTQDALTTIQAAAAHVIQAASNVAPAKTA